MYMFIIIAYINIVRLKRSRWKWLFVRSRTGRGEARACAVTAVNSLSCKGGVRVERGCFPTHHQNHPAPGEQAALCNRPSWSHWADTILPTASHTPPILPYYAKAARAGIPRGPKATNPQAAAEDWGSCGERTKRACWERPKSTQVPLLSVSGPPFQFSSGYL